MFEFLISGVKVNEVPQGWDKITSTLKIDNELKGLTRTMDVSLTFWNDGYDIIKSEFNTAGHTSSLPVEIRQIDLSSSDRFYKVIYYGIIFMKDVVFSEGIGGSSAKCSIKDNSFFASIFNNKNIKARIYVGKSKNGLAITPAQYTRVHFFTPTTGVYNAIYTGAGNERNNTAFSVYDVLKFFIDFMTDGEVDFISDTFDVGGEFEGHVITNGYTSRFALSPGLSQELFDINWPDLSFSEVFRELDVQFNLAFSIGFNGGRPFMRIEKKEYLYPSSVLHTFEGVDKIDRSVVSEQLYSSVKLGSDVTEDEVFLQFPETIRMLGFKSEEYIVLGKANIDRQLDLSNKWIISSNVIEDLVINGATTAPTTYDDNIVLMKGTYDGVNLWYDADQSNWLTGAATPMYYNEALTSNQKLIRHYKGIPNSIAQQLSTTDLTSYALVQNPLNTGGGFAVIKNIEPLRCEHEQSDPSNKYNPATFEYTITDAGTYSFHVDWKFSVLVYPSYIPNLRIKIYLRRYDNLGFAGGNLLNTVNIFSQIYHNTADFSGIASASGSINAVANDKIVVRIEANTGTPGVLIAGQVNSVFACTASSNGGGEYLTTDPSKYPVIRSSFKAPMSFADYMALQTDPRGLIGYSVEKGKKYFGHLEELLFNHFENSAKVSVISDEVINK